MNYLSIFKKHLRRKLTNIYTRSKNHLVSTHTHMSHIKMWYPFSLCCQRSTEFKSFPISPFITWQPPNLFMDANSSLQSALNGGLHVLLPYSNLFSSAPQNSYIQCPYIQEMWQQPRDQEER